MNNSSTPLFFALATITAAVLWLYVSPVAEPGSEGPRLAPGILRLPKDERRLIPSAPITATNERIATPTSAAISTVFPESWTTVIVGASDSNPMTACVVLGLAEELTRRGTVAIIVTTDAPIHPLGADLSLHVSTDLSAIPPDPRSDWRGVIHANWYDLRLPNEHPGAAYHGVSSSESGVISLAHHSTATDASAHWSERYAAVGRSIATGILTELHAPLSPVKRLVSRDWGSALKLPPQCQGLHWHGAFQDDFVRGWVGHLSEKNYSDLEHRLTNGHWTATPHAPPQWQLWQRDQEYFSFHDGQVACWQEATDVPALIETWLTDAQSSNADRAHNAQQHLRRYAQLAALPATLRARIAGLIPAEKP